MVLRKKLFVVLLVAMLVGLSLTAQAGNDRRIRYMGTSVFTMPTAYTRSALCYINDNSHTATLLSQSLMNGFMEMSMLRHMNGAEDGKNILNAKIKLLDEGMITPAVAWGVSDVNTQLGSKVFYFAGSKSIEAFGAQIHAGFYKDPVTTEKIEWYGFEKMIFPLVTVAAERTDDKNTFGVKLSPYPGLSLEIAQRDSEEELYNIVYYRSF